MDKKVYNSSEETGLPFSEAIESNGFVFIAGQIHLDETGNLVEGDIETKTHQVMKNIQKILKGVGLTFSDIVKAEIFLPDLSNGPKVNEVYTSYLSHPYPARVTVGVKALPLGADIEIATIAARK